jgi:site-specific recombinase XerD
VELPPAVRGWHALRHTYASTLLAEGTDLATVSRLMGHASIAETAQTYAHALPGRDDAARNVAAAALSTVVPARA